MHKLSCLLLSLILTSAFADDTPNINSTYINRNAYIQNLWNGLTSAGGTQTSSESQVLTQNIAEQWFSDGTWNFWGTASVQYTGYSQGFTNYAYGGNFFAQTGQVAGFSFGGAMAIINPFFATNLNGNDPLQQSELLPSEKQVTPLQAFAEYQYQNILQVDAGWIGVNNSPWLSANYYVNMLTAPYTYQGALVNVNPGGGWLLTAVGLNAAQGISSSGFSGLTDYNTSYNPISGLISNNTATGTSAGSLAFGANYSGANNQYNLRLWDYEFQNYGHILYADSNLKFKPTSNLAFNVALQGGMDNANGLLGNDNNNAFTTSGYGQISSNFAGIQGGLAYKWFTLNVGYNNVWGPSDSFGNGAIVSPYTFAIATDPLFSTPYIAGLVDLGTAGSALKISPSFNFLNGNLSIAPAFTSFTAASPLYNGTNEYDLIANYSIPQIKGLNFFAVYAYQQLPLSNELGSNYVTQLFVSYLY